MMSAEERTCKADSKIPIKFKDMFGNTLMFCYEKSDYIPVSRCNSRHPNATCDKFQSIKDFKEATKE